MKSGRQAGLSRKSPLVGKKKETWKACLMGQGMWGPAGMSAFAGKEERTVPFGKEPASENHAGTYVRRSEGTAVMRTPRKWSWSAPPKGRVSERIVLEEERERERRTMGWAECECGEATKAEGSSGGDRQERGGEQRMHGFCEKTRKIRSSARVKELS